MHDSIRIEPATMEDLPQLVELLVDLFAMEADFVPDRVRQERGLKLILEQPARGRIFVLRNDHRLIGMINLLITISTAEGGFVLLLEDVVVHRDHRGQGYGSKLLEHAVRFARQKNFLRITLLTDRGNEASKRFYLDRGFVESDMVPLRMLFRD
ncbi:MAG: GNAT family N-acetyltransferase [Terrimicrobiaceae bacterium]|nr:GNAT family N-acetyltransferase [Terrimicrobiaceae bacterium]